MASIADVYVSVSGETTKLTEDIKRALRAADPAVREAGGRWKRELEGQLKDVKVRVDADTTKARAEIDSIGGKSVQVKVDVDDSALRRSFGGGGGGGGGRGGGLASWFSNPVKLNIGLVGIGLLPAATTAVTQLAGALQQLAGAGLVMPGVFAGLMSSVGTAALGMHGMKDALEAVNKASDGTKASVEAANAALAGLSTNQAEAVKTISGLKGTLTDLRNIAGNNLFEGFSGGLKEMVGNLLPAATKGIDGISRGLNQNLLQTMKSLGSGPSQGLLERIFGNTSNAQGKLTAAIDPIVHAFGTLAAAGSDSLPRLADAVGKVADRFNAFITHADGDGRLDKWIREGLDGFTNLGNILLNLGKSFVGITQAAGGGAGLLGTLESLTGRMSTFLNSTEGQTKLREFFTQGREQLGQLKDIAVQLGPILSGIFKAGMSAASGWLPVIREVLSILNRIPGGAQAVVTAFVAWRTISGISSLVNSLNMLSGVLSSLPGKANAAGGAMSSALTLAGPLAAATALAGAYDGILHKIDSITGSHIASDIGEIPGSGAWVYDRVVNGKPWFPQQSLGGTHNPNQQVAPNGSGQLGFSTAPTPGAKYDPFAVMGVPAPTPGQGGWTPKTSFQWGGPQVPAVSSYSPPVITQPSGGSGTPSLPFDYSAGADPYSYTSGMYGLPAGTNSGGYGGKGAQFPAWVQQLGEAFGVKPSTYPGHQESDRNEPGYAPNPNHENRAIDWSGPVENMQKFAEYLASIGQDLEQVIWKNPMTGQEIGIAGGQPSGHAYYASDWGAHENHVHTRQSQPIPLPGMSPDMSGYGGTGLTSQDLTLRNAQQRVSDTQARIDSAQGRLNELNAKDHVTPRQKEEAERSLAVAKREHADAIDALAVAQDKYNKSAGKDKSGGSGDFSSLGTDLMGGIAEFFGFDGSLFKNPADFGIMKFITGAANLKVGSGSSGAQGMPSGGGGNLLGGVLGMLPNIGQLMPGMPGGNSPNILDAAQFKPPGGPDSPGPGNTGYNNTGIDMRGAQLGVNPGDLTNTLNSVTSSQNRWGPLLQNAAK